MKFHETSFDEYINKTKNLDFALIEDELKTKLLWQICLIAGLKIH